MKRLVVLEIPGLTRRMVRDHAPALRKLGNDGRFDLLAPELPAVTIPGHATLCTGLKVSDHGIVGNGWFDRDENCVKFWQQSEKLVAGEKVWEAAKKRDPDFTAFKFFWWPGMASSADLFGNVRPAYCADGRKLPDIYLNVPGLAAELQEAKGQFPLFRFWGPASDIRSSEWIADAARHLIDKRSTTLSLVYLPHLDYRQQSHGPNDDQMPQHVADLDRVAGDLIDHVRQQDIEVMVVSGYHIAPVNRPVYLNRLFRQQGWLQVITNATGELIDYATSRVFAVADHQVAHVYVQDKDLQNEVADLVSTVPGVARVMDRESQRDVGIYHRRGGELLALAERNSWFAYYYWNEDEKAPDFARTVAIHDKPGYDPCELILDPTIRLPKWKIATKLLRKTLGMRYLMDVIPLDANLVKGSHGLLPESADDHPVFLCSQPNGIDAQTIPMTAVKGEMLRCLFDE